jgi:hypothetical protein
MGFDTDMRKVQERFKRWADANIVTNDAFSAAEGMINYYGGERERIFDSLQNELKRDRDIQSNWDSHCDKGYSLLESANSSISGKIPDGFKGIGMSDFYEGEKAIWQQCKNSKIGLLAEGIFLCNLSSVEMYKKLEEDLKRTAEDARLVDELAKAAFGSMSESIKEAGVHIAAVLAAAPVAAIPLIGKVFAPGIRKSVQSMLGGVGTVRDLTRKKAIARKVLADNRELVNKAKDQVGPEAIEILRSKARDNINSWKSSRGDYGAEDWGSLARPCMDLIDAKAVPAIEKAKSLIYSMDPLYVESMSKVFISLFSDPSMLATYDEKLSNDAKKVLEDVTRQELKLSEIRDNPEKRNAEAELKQVKAETEAALTALKNALRESSNELKG